ncbi:hypothetical protein [Pseudomonas sp. 22 E 5]|uniref:hypothetical protein n=1 Tax=unclassified Pseudomonas TaxID=196821 RepID=UPI00081234F5|nr:MULTISPECIES: hypothetical protein [unclassified Pseudomonas]MCX9149463.1 hypothetical protein [Pseudomonas sp. TB1-B1]CRM16446.1 hypothetical protein [Pseudomonas sp. 31 E 6]CRM31334.1 hypothetical protein [Pseudomonas sp. 31 E 5]CRM92431.1 hypothetical protein [Pseudomonas sp. 22 E 5]
MTDVAMTQQHALHRDTAAVVLLGRLFDVIGRRVMISFTYAISGVLLAVSGYAFQQAAD